MFLTAGCGRAAPADSFVAPDLSAVPGEWNGVSVNCDTSPKLPDLGDDPGVIGVTCAEYTDLDAVSDPDALLMALQSSILEVMPSVVVKESGCSPVTQLFPLAFQSCSAQFVFQDGSEGLVQVFMYVEASPEGLAVLGERRDAKGDLEPEDYEGVPVTATVAVAWGYPVQPTA